jgi:hypothetical protein
VWSLAPLEVRVAWGCPPCPPPPPPQLDFPPREGESAPDAAVSAKKIAAALEPFYHANRAAFKLVVERGPLIDELTLASERASCGWFVAVLREASDVLVR